MDWSALRWGVPRVLRDGVAVAVGVLRALRAGVGKTAVADVAAPEKVRLAAGVCASCWMCRTRTSLGGGCEEERLRVAGVCEEEEAMPTRYGVYAGGWVDGGGCGLSRDGKLA